MQTLDQRYAGAILKQMQEIKQEPKQEYTKYASIAHKLPILIYTAGLAQAVEFVHARGASIQRRLLAHLGSVILDQETEEALREAIRRASLREYLRLTRQVLAALLWYKRFAQSILGIDASEADLVEEENER